MWLRVDSAGYQEQVLEGAEGHGADFTVTARGYGNVNAAVHALAADPATIWTAADGRETDAGSQTVSFTTQVPFCSVDRDFDNHDFPLQQGHFRVTTQALRPDFSR